MTPPITACIGRAHHLARLGFHHCAVRALLAAAQAGLADLTRGGSGAGASGSASTPTAPAAPVGDPKVLKERVAAQFAAARTVADALRSGYKAHGKDAEVARALSAADLAASSGAEKGARDSGAPRAFM